MKALLDSGAEFSPDGQHRYRLWRRWADGPMLMVIGLNPSTADETTDDPTVRRCLGFAHDWGYAGLRMLNLFAFRATDPKAMLRATVPVGVLNDQHIFDASGETITEGGAILAAWGNHGAYLDRSALVFADLDYHFRPVACLGFTQLGEPRHPLYLAKTTQPIRYIGDGGRLVTK